jgi:hypothetical protein
MQYIHGVRWSVAGELVLCITSLFAALCLAVSTYTTHVLIAQALYVVFTLLYHTMITVVSYVHVFNVNNSTLCTQSAEAILQLWLYQRHTVLSSDVTRLWH